MRTRHQLTAFAAGRRNARDRQKVVATNIDRGRLFCLTGNSVKDACR
jgi:hypothetical protein